MKGAITRDLGKDLHEANIFMGITLIIFFMAVGFPTLINTSPSIGYDQNTIQRMTPVTSYYQQAFAEEQEMNVLGNYNFDPMIAFLIIPNTIDLPPPDIVKYFELKYSQLTEFEYGFINFEDLKELSSKYNFLDSNFKILPEAYADTDTFGFSVGTHHDILTTSLIAVCSTTASSRSTAGHIEIDTDGSTTPCRRVSVEWDISSIPDNAVITNTVLRYDISTALNPRVCDFNSMEKQPSTSTDQVVLDDIGNGTTFVNADSGCTTVGNDKILDLGASADADLQANLLSDWWAVGAKFDSESRNSLPHFQFMTTTELQVTYTTFVPNPITDLQARIQNETSIYSAGVVGNSLTFGSNTIPQYAVQQIPSAGFSSPTLIDSVRMGSAFGSSVTGTIKGVIVGDRTGDLVEGSNLSDLYFIENSTNTYDASVLTVGGVTLIFNFSGNTILDSNDNQVGIGLLLERTGGGAMELRHSGNTNLGTWDGFTTTTSGYSLVSGLSACVEDDENTLRDVACNAFTNGDIGNMNVYGGNARAVLNWTAPASSGDPITGYEVLRVNSTNVQIFDEGQFGETVTDREAIGTDASPLGFIGQRITFPEDVVLQSLVYWLGDFPVGVPTPAGITQGVVLLGNNSGTADIIRVANSTSTRNHFCGNGCGATTLPTTFIASGSLIEEDFANVTLEGGVEYIIGVEILNGFGFTSPCAPTCISTTASFGVQKDIDDATGHPNSGLGVFTEKSISTGDVWTDDATKEWNANFYGFPFEVEVADTGNADTEYTSTADFPSEDRKINAYKFSVQAINGNGTADSSNVVEISPDRSDSIDSWQYYEWDDRGDFHSDWRFGFTDSSYPEGQLGFNMTMPAGGISDVGIFKSFDASLIDGSDLKFDYNHNPTVGVNTFSPIFFVLDGSFDKDNALDFPRNVGSFNIKGGGLLATIIPDIPTDCVLGASTSRVCSVTVDGATINYAGSTESEITVAMFTSQSASGFTKSGTMRNIEISNVGSWNFTNPRIIKQIDQDFADATFDDNQNDRGVLVSNSVVNGTVVIFPVPDAPANVNATADIDTVVVEWDAVTATPEVDRYWVERSDNIPSVNSTWFFNEVEIDFSGASLCVGSTFGGIGTSHAGSPDWDDCYTYKLFRGSDVAFTTVQMNGELTHSFTQSGFDASARLWSCSSVPTQSPFNFLSVCSPLSSALFYTGNGGAETKTFVIGNTTTTPYIATVLLHHDLTILNHFNLAILHWINFTSSGEPYIYINAVGSSFTPVVTGTDADYGFYTTPAPVITPAFEVIENTDGLDLVFDEEFSTYTDNATANLTWVPTVAGLGASDDIAGVNSTADNLVLRANTQSSSRIKIDLETLLGEKITDSVGNGNFSLRWQSQAIEDEANVVGGTQVVGLFESDPSLGYDGVNTGFVGEFNFRQGATLNTIVLRQDDSDVAGAFNSNLGSDGSCGTGSTVFPDSSPDDGITDSAVTVYHELSYSIGTSLNNWNYRAGTNPDFTGLGCTTGANLSSDDLDNLKYLVVLQPNTGLGTDPDSTSFYDNFELYSDAFGNRTFFIDTTQDRATDYTYRVFGENIGGNGTGTESNIVLTNDVPDQVQNLSFDNSTTGIINLDWDDLTYNSGEGNPSTGLNLTKYEIFRNNVTTGGGFYLLASNLASSPPQNFYNDTDIDAGNEYDYKVSACNAIDCGSNSTTVTAIAGSVNATQLLSDFTAFADTTALISPPFPITTLAGATISNTCQLSWTAPADGNSPINGYKILRQATGEGSFSVLVANTTTTLTSYTDTGLVNGIIYQYDVRGLNAFGDSIASNIVDCQPVVGGVPNEPTNLDADEESNGDVTLTWNEPATGDPTGYRVERKVGQGSFVILTNNTGTPALTYLDSTTSPATEYTYRVAGWNPFGLDGYSNEATINTSNPPQAPVLSAVQNVNQIDLSWIAPFSDNPINGYKIDRRVNLGSFTTLVANTTTTAITYTDTDVVKPNTYGYRVSALSSSGQGALSNVVDVIFGSHVVVQVREQDGSGFKGGGRVKISNSTFDDEVSLNANSNAIFDNYPVANFNYTFFDNSNFILNKTFNFPFPSGNNTATFTINALVFDVDCPTNGQGADVRIKVNYTDDKDIFSFPSTPVCDSSDQVSWSTRWVGANMVDESRMVSDFISTLFRTNAVQFLASSAIIPTTYSSGTNAITSDLFQVNASDTTINFNLFLGRAPAGGGGGGSGGGGSSAPVESGQSAIPATKIIIKDQLTGLSVLSRTHPFAKAGDVIQGTVTVQWEGESPLTITGINEKEFSEYIVFDQPPIALEQRIVGIGDFAKSEADIPYSITLPADICDPDIGITQNCVNAELLDFPLEFEFDFEGVRYEASTDVFVDLSPIPFDIVQLQVILLGVALIASALAGNYIRKKLKPKLRQESQKKKKFKKKFDAS